MCRHENQEIDMPCNHEECQKNQNGFLPHNLNIAPGDLQHKNPLPHSMDLSHLNGFPNDYSRLYKPIVKLECKNETDKIEEVSVNQNQNFIEENANFDNSTFNKYYQSSAKKVSQQTISSIPQRIPPHNMMPPMMNHMQQQNMNPYMSNMVSSMNIFPNNQNGMMSQIHNALQPSNNNNLNPAHFQQYMRSKMQMVPNNSNPYQSMNGQPGGMNAPQQTSSYINPMMQPNQHSGFIRENQTNNMQNDHDFKAGGNNFTELMVMENYMKEFQNKILALMLNHNKALLEIKEKNDVLQESISCLLNEFKSLKFLFKQINPKDTQTVTSSSNISFPCGRTSDAVGADTIIAFLYQPQIVFKYHLVVKNDLPSPLYRERNFSFGVELQDLKGCRIKNSNRITLSIAIYTSENPPKLVEMNTSGNTIMKGLIEKDLVDGEAIFDKIQIKEVTSHFRNGWVFLMIYPKSTNSTNPIMTIGSNSTSIVVDYNIIKPAVVEKVIVKAKKNKDRFSDGMNGNGSGSGETKEEIKDSDEESKKADDIVYSSQSILNNALQFG